MFYGKFTGLKRFLNLLTEFNIFIIIIIRMLFVLFFQTEEKLAHGELENSCEITGWSLLTTKGVEVELAVFAAGTRQ